MVVNGLMKKGLDGRIGGRFKVKGGSTNHDEQWTMTER
jgi:hypothetical protein